MATQKTFIEELEIAGDQLIATIKKLLADGNAQRVIVRDAEGREIIAMPLTFGVLTGGVLVLAAPLLAVLGALAALLTKVRLDVVRVTEPTDEAPSDPEAAGEPPTEPAEAPNHEDETPEGAPSDESKPKTQTHDEDPLG